MEKTKKKRRRNNNSHIPTDIIFENILIRVPAKSLMRFKLVCKLWQSTILHDRRFHLSHRRLSPSRPSILGFVGPYYPIRAGGSVDLTQSSREGYYYPTKCLNKVKVDHNRFVCSSIRSSDSTCADWEKTVWKDYYTTEVVNGIVCFYSKNNIYLCNLSTSETMKLPSSPGTNNHHYNYNHLCCYYLGFDDLNNVYKLLKVPPQDEYYIMAIDRDTPKIMTIGYNNQTNDQNQDGYCWRNASIVDSVQFRRSYCFKSALYWIGKGRLVRYDLDKESYSLIQYPREAFKATPPCMWNGRGRYYDTLEAGLTQVGGRLALTHSYMGATEFNIWLLHHNYEQSAWDKISIHIPINLRPCKALSFFVTTPGVANNKIVLTIGRTLLYKPLSGLHMPVYSYDIESETWETLDNDYLHAAAAASSPKLQAAYKDYSHIYYFHEDNILPLKDILAPK